MKITVTVCQWHWQTKFKQYHNWTVYHHSIKNLHSNAVTVSPDRTWLITS